MNWNITAGRPVYVQLVEQLELALVAGEFPPGSRIPPVRELAADAGVNPNTMQRALQELESRGLLQAQRTAGRTVTADDTALQALRRRRAGTLAAEFLHRCGMERIALLGFSNNLKAQYFQKHRADIDRRVSHTDDQSKSDNS